MNKLAISLFLGIITQSTAVASNVYDIDLDRIHTNRFGGGAYLVLANPRSGDPCPGDDKTYYIDFSSSAGKEMYSQALTAFAGGFKLTIIGAGACGGPANAELIDDLQLSR